MAKSRRFLPIGILSAAALLAGPGIVSAPLSSSAPVTVQQDVNAKAPTNERAPAPRATARQVRLADIGGGFVREVRRWEPIWTGRPRPRRMLHTRFARG